MSEYQPGQVAVATVRGVKDVRVVRTQHDNMEWMSIDRTVPDGFSDTPVWHHADLHVTDIRPLVVLDLDEVWLPAEADRVRTIAAQLRKGGDAGAQIAVQIEAQTKPARIPEPGRYGVVEAKYRGDTFPHEWVSDGKNWTNLDTGTAAGWNLLTDPVLVREGVA